MKVAQNGCRSDIQPAGPESDQGLGLIEIVVSMFMLAILAIALLPLLVNGLKASTSNTTQATATQLVAERMQLAQYAGTACADVRNLAGVAVVTDSRGVQLQVTTTTGNCDGSPTIAMSAAVVRLDTNVVLANASTLVYVGD